MVRAILAGAKTQTRRVIGQLITCGDAEWFVESKAGLWRCPFGVPGDRLFVRETWQAIHVFVDPETGCGDGLEYSTTIPTSDRDGWWTPVYAATDPQASEHRDDRGFPWRPAIHMPRWASRITLEVTGVRVERLQEITCRDAAAEGMPSGDPLPPLTAFRLLWDTINGKAGRRWADNPWCWCVSFRRVQP